MFNLVFELFYILYPAFFRVATFPLEVLFFVQNRLAPAEVPAVNYLNYVLFTCILPPVGITFISQLAHLIFKHKLQTPMTTKHWWVFFGGLVLISSGIQVLIYAFPQSLIIETIVSQPVRMVWLCIGLGGLGAIFYYLFKAIIYLLLQRITVIQSSRPIQRALLGGLMLVGMYPFLLIVFVLLELFVNPLGTPAASQFFVINAAIKNTCFIDPEKNNCPQTLAEIGYIEPRAYQEMIAHNQVNYVYDPQKNLYTLVVRYHPTRAVVFDWRLVDTFGVDLHEYEVSVIGQDRLIDPPAYDGPWTFADWDYRSF